MKASELPEILKSSALAELFVDLDAPTEEDLGEDGQLVKLQFLSVLSEKDQHLLIVAEDASEMALVMPRLAHGRDQDSLGRIGHVNKQLRIPKLSWDPDDGEILVSWTLLKDEETTISPTSVERVLAHMIYVFCGESIWFFEHNTAGNIPKELQKDMIENARKRLSEIFKPALTDLL